MKKSSARLRVVWALGKRDLRRYFTNPTGYVFVTLFIFLSAAAAFWQPRFFLNNLANLDQLNDAFPFLLLFFVPALTMGIWSEERQQGTDELLLTLPATESEIVLGKYVAALGIYTAAVALSLSHVLVLFWLGHPDSGLLASNYIGYWLLGVSLVPVAMLGSLLAANATMAFIVGVIFCAIPIVVSPAASVFSETAARRLAAFSVFPYFGDFTRGVVSVTGVLYFVFLTMLFLFLNVRMLARRYSRGQADQVAPVAHDAVRTIALAFAMACLVALVGRTHLRFDITAERMHSLSDETKEIVAAVPDNRPVLVQAFLSPDVPEQLVQTRETILDVLREIEARAGPKVTVAIEATEPYSEQARLARERYGILPRQAGDQYSDERLQDVFLGVAFTSGADEAIIPFFERGLSIEYEVARAIRVVSRGARKRIGVVDSDTKIFGGVDFASNQARPSWQVLDELRKQYEVVELQPAAPIKEEMDALLVVLPSRLSQSEMDLVEGRIKQGTPTMILVDPLPAMDVSLAPAAQMAQQMNPYGERPTASTNYGDVRKMLIDLGVNWVPARIAWDGYNPHPDMSDLPKETVFVATGNGNAEAFNRKHAATSGLEELLLLYPGYLLPAEPSKFTFEPLLQTGKLSGLSSFFDLVRPSPQGLVLNASLTHNPDNQQHVLAAQVRAKTADPANDGARPTNVIVVADLDFISDYFFDIRSAASVNANFDNITFFLNAIDVLAGDQSFVALRNRRVKHRTLERVETQTRSFVERRTREEQQAEKDARAALDEARNRLKSRVQDIDARRDLDAQAKEIMARNLQETEERRLRVLETTIDQEKNAKIQASRETMEAQVRRIRSAIRTVAVLLPPIPVLLVGATIFVRRERRERENARVLRRLRHA